MPGPGAVPDGLVGLVTPGDRASSLEVVTYARTMAGTGPRADAGGFAMAGATIFFYSRSSVNV
jgi:hypothetical protein